MLILLAGLDKNQGFICKNLCESMCLLQILVCYGDIFVLTNWKKIIMNCKVSNWKTFHEQEAEALGKKDEKRLLETRKLSLVVDLDQTLIHTTMELIPENMKVQLSQT